MFDISFVKTEGDPVYLIANFNVSSGDEVKMYIHHDNNEGECWTAYLEIHSPNCTESYIYGDTLGCSDQKELIEEGLSQNNVTVTSEELEIITNRTTEIIKATWPTGSAADSFFAV